MNVVIGINAAGSALRNPATRPERLRVAEGRSGRRIDELVDLAEARGCVVERVTAATLSAAAGGRHQGVLLELEAAAEPTEQDLARLVREHEQPLFVVLDGVTDPRNLGACVRSAAGMGAAAVLLPKHNSASMTAVATKTASGGADRVPVIVVANLARTLEDLQAAGVWVVGLVAEEVEPLDRVDLKGAVALVLGAEDRGLRNLTRRQCDFLAMIPMADLDQSLNVSVATGIALYEAVRQRGGA